MGGEGRSWRQTSTSAVAGNNVVSRASQEGYFLSLLPPEKKSRELTDEGTLSVANGSVERFVFSNKSTNCMR